MLDLSDITGFEWDEGNRDKNWIRHQVSNNECEEVFFNVPLLVDPDPRHSQTESRYYLLGQTDAGRNLFIVFVIREQRIRVVSARDMDKKERSIYAKASA